MNSKITITFNNPAQVGDILQIQDSNTSSVLIDIQFSTTTFSLPVTGVIDDDILNVVNLLENGYNSTNRYTITPDYTANTIEVLDNIGSTLFSEETNNTFGRLTTLIENGTVIVPISITSITAQENGLNPCFLVQLEILTNQQATQITSPVNQSVATNPFTITDITRDSINDIVVALNDANTYTTQNIYVPLLNSSYFDLQIVKSPSSNVVNVISLYDREPAFDIEYSLDGVTYYSSSSFSGLAVGNYTLYVRDSIGCSFSTPFEITAFEPNVFERTPFFRVSNQNSLITVKNETIDNINTFCNPTNTLSFQEGSEINYRNFKQLFQTTDGVIKQQFKSNYETVVIKLVDCDDNETILTQTQKTQNFDITDVRDVTINSFNYQNSSFVGVQYVTGNTYDPDTLDVTGQYNLGTQVPDFMNVDGYIQIQGAGWYRVKDIEYYNGIETLILDVLETSFPFAVTGQTLRGTAIYNVLPYEVFEFEFDCNSLSGDYYITYEATDSEFDQVSYITEWFNVSVEQRNTYLLQYYNTENNETNYSFGIRNKLRIPYIRTLDYIPNDTQDVYLTDTNAVSIETSYRDFFGLSTVPIPLGFVRKIGLAVSNDRLFLNGLSLLKNAELESTRVGVNNLYNLTIQFIRSDYAFTSIADDGSINLPDGEILGVDDNTEEVLSTKD